MSYDGNQPNLETNANHGKPDRTPRLPRKRRSLARTGNGADEQIATAVLKRGDKLPTESAIMEAQGVSVPWCVMRFAFAGGGPGGNSPRHRHFCARHAEPKRVSHRPGDRGDLRDVLAILELRISLEASPQALLRSAGPEQLATMRAALDA